MGTDFEENLDQLQHEQEMINAAKLPQSNPEVLAGQILTQEQTQNEDGGNNEQGNKS